MAKLRGGWGLSCEMPLEYQLQFQIQILEPQRGNTVSSGGRNEFLFCIAVSLACRSCQHQSVTGTGAVQHLCFFLSGEG